MFVVGPESIAQETLSFSGVNRHRVESIACAKHRFGADVPEETEKLASIVVLPNERRSVHPNCDCEINVAFYDGFFSTGCLAWHAKQTGQGDEDKYVKSCVHALLCR